MNQPPISQKLNLLICNVLKSETLISEIVVLFAMQRQVPTSVCLHLYSSISLFYVCLMQVLVSISTVIGGVLRHLKRPLF